MIECLVSIRSGNKEIFNGADTKSRTRDLLITSQLLYQLSYVGDTLNKDEIKNGADTKSRTRDLLITSQLLYQLSYVGIFNLFFLNLNHIPKVVITADRGRK